LQHSTKYHYAMGFGHTVRTFSFTTPPKPGPDAPFKFGLIGNQLPSLFRSNSFLPPQKKNIILDYVKFFLGLYENSINT